MKNKSKKIIVLFLSVLLVLSTTLGNSSVVSAATVSLSKTKATVYVGNTYALKVTGTTRTVAWKTSNKNVASVSSTGVISGCKKGSAIISATVNGKTYKCTVTVSNPYITPTTASVNIGETSTLSLKGASKSAKITWTSSDESIATISSFGIVTGITEGTVTIKATVGEKTYERNVTVNESDKTANSMTYSGSGDKVLSGLSLDGGIYTIKLYHEGKSNFIVHPYIDGKKGISLANEIGTCALQSVLNNGKYLKTDNLMLEVKADGNWKIIIEPLGSQSTVSVYGSGKCVSGTFTSGDLTSVVILKHDGKRNFIVHLVSTDGTYTSFANEIGEYSGEKVITLKKDKTYFWTVYADGNWSISLNGETKSTDNTLESAAPIVDNSNDSNTKSETDLSNWSLATEDQINADVSVDFVSSYSTVIAATFQNNNNYNMEINPTASIITNNVIYTLVPIDSNGNIITKNTIVNPNQSIEIYFGTANHNNYYINKTSDIIFDIDYNNTHYRSKINNSSGVQFLYNNEATQ